jgi:hypothetical protein
MAWEAIPRRRGAIGAGDDETWRKLPAIRIGENGTSINHIAATTFRLHAGTAICIFIDYETRMIALKRAVTEAEISVGFSLRHISKSGGQRPNITQALVFGCQRLHDFATANGVIRTSFPLTLNEADRLFVATITPGQSYGCGLTGPPEQRPPRDPMRRRSA